MKKIITITLNPAFDIHYKMDSFEPYKENYAHSIICEAGGKGVNISRALVLNGVDNTAYIVLGEENCATFENSLRADGLNYKPIYVNGRIRENITLHPSDRSETRISLDNFSLSQKTLELICDMLLAEIDENTVIAFSGRIPKGISEDEAIGFLKKLKASGARLAVDSNSLGVDSLRKIKPWFIKPNEHEVLSLVGDIGTDICAAASAAKALVNAGVSEEVMISLGGLGSVWSDGERSFAISVPTIDSPVSTIGAGDSTIAGYIAAVASEDKLEDALRLACAFGTSACLTEGTRPPRKEDIEKIFESITLKEVN